MGLSCLKLPNACPHTPARSTVGTQGFPGPRGPGRLLGESVEETQRDPATPKPHLRGDFMFTAEVEEHLQKAQQPESQVRRFNSHKWEP